MRSTSLVSEASFTVVCDSESLTLLLVFLHCKTFGRLNEFTVFHKGDVNHAGLPLWKLCGRWATHVHFDFHAYTVFPCEGDEKILDSTSMPSWLIWQLKDFAPSEKVFFYSTVLMWHIWPLHHIWTHNWYCTYLHSPALKCWNVTPFVLIGYVDCEKEVFKKKQFTALLSGKVQFPFFVTAHHCSSPVQLSFENLHVEEKEEEKYTVWKTVMVLL